jgi:hypothetical protein
MSHPLADAAPSPELAGWALGITCLCVLVVVAAIVLVVVLVKRSRK